MTGKYDRGAVTGLKEAKAALLSAPAIVQENVLLANDISTKQMLHEARSRCPKETGTLASFLEMKAPTLRNPFGVVGIRKGSVSVLRPGRTRTERRTPGSYAHLVEYGFMHKQSGRRVQGQPFMIPAAEALRRAHADRVNRAVQQAEKEIADRAAKVAA